MLFDHIRLGDVFLGIYSGWSHIYYMDSSWDEVHAGDVTFWCDQWKITIFNDCDDIDYTDSFTTPEGRTYSYDQLSSLNLDHIRYGLGRLMDDDKLKFIFKLAKKYEG